MSILLIGMLLFLLSSCNDNGNELPQNAPSTVDKEALYDQAIKKLTGNESVNTTRLDKRFTALEQQLSGFVDGDEEMDIAEFTRIKIAMDYLEGEGYDPGKITRLETMFKAAYAEAEGKIEDIDGSLADRYNELNRTLQRVSSGDDVLTLPRYLEMERGINELEKDGYMIASRIASLRTGLLQAVLHELETALIHFEVPEEVGVEQLPDEEDAVEGGSDGDESDAVDESETDVASDVPEESLQPVIRLVDGGLDKEKMTVKVGQTVIFENDRQGHYKLGFVVGNRVCRDLKSGFFNSGESYNWTFVEEQTCWVSDGIFTTEAVKIVVIG
ncbi:MAG TPA: hypothetical protein VJI15_02250 [Candidatus Nanoarchaeia archaeon]|nr:hypothetical protein [Candidatus Nanoarchaeia archaeon]